MPRWGLDATKKSPLARGLSDDECALEVLRPTLRATSVWGSTRRPGSGMSVPAGDRPGHSDPPPRSVPDKVAVGENGLDRSLSARVAPRPAHGLGPESILERSLASPYPTLRGGSTIVFSPDSGPFLCPGGILVVGNVDPGVHAPRPASSPGLAETPDPKPPTSDPAYPGRRGPIAEPKSRSSTSIGPVLAAAERRFRDDSGRQNSLV
jgi:hypothetical protein